MPFTPIDLDRWPRREVFDHYSSAVPCTYSMTTKLDITVLRRRGQKLYPALLHGTAAVINRHEEFRMAFREDGQLGIYDQLHPCYTVFHQDDQTFSNLWTPFSPDYADFLAAYEADLRKYGDQKGFFPKSGLPENHFTVSMVPWRSFDAFHLNIQKGYRYLIPIFTFGKYYEEGGKWLLPMAAQVHHAVCDGFHLCRLMEELQARLDGAGIENGGSNGL